MEPLISNMEVQKSSGEVNLQNNAKDMGRLAGLFDDLSKAGHGSVVLHWKYKAR